MRPSWAQFKAIPAGPRPDSRPALSLTSSQIPLQRGPDQGDLTPWLWLTPRCPRAFQGQTLGGRCEDCAPSLLYGEVGEPGRLAQWLDASVRGEVLDTDLRGIQSILVVQVLSPDRTPPLSQLF